MELGNLVRLAATQEKMSIYDNTEKNSSFRFPSKSSLAVQLYASLFWEREKASPDHNYSQLVLKAITNGIYFLLLKHSIVESPKFYFMQTNYLQIQLSANE